MAQFNAQNANWERPVEREHDLFLLMATADIQTDEGGSEKHARVRQSKYADSHFVTIVVREHPET